MAGAVENRYQLRPLIGDIQVIEVKTSQKPQERVPFLLCNAACPPSGAYRVVSGLEGSISSEKNLIIDGEQVIFFDDEGLMAVRCYEDLNEDDIFVLERCTCSIEFN